jgi:GNAT superfamily N-acetyltransferase
MAIAYQREDDLSVADYVSVLGRTTMVTKRPLANPERIQAMLDGANFIVTARDETGAIVGLARCITDFAWIAYCAELAVSETHQGKGIGKAIIETAKSLLGPKLGFVLVSEPEAVDFYRRVGMAEYSAFLITREDPS